MKISISFKPQEQDTAETVLQAARRILPRSRIHKTDNKPPFIHLYLTTKNEDRPHSDKKNS